MNEPIRSFLLIGQSNMAGRGIIGEVPPIDPRGVMFMLRNGRWQTMTEPINPDRRIFVEKDTDFRSGISLAASFAEAYVHAYGGKVGLIPCADGGTCIDQWAPGEILYDHAVMQTRLALRTSTLAGILWHQGESDAKTAEDAAAYEEKFRKLFDRLPGDLGADSGIPVVVGEIRDFSDRFPYWEQINKALHHIADTRPLTAVASASGLNASADGLHFNAASYRELGRRYFAQYARLREGIG